MAEQVSAHEPSRLSSGEHGILEVITTSAHRARVGASVAYPEQRLPYCESSTTPAGTSPAMEVPELYVGDLRAFFASLR